MIKEKTVILKNWNNNKIEFNPTQGIDIIYKQISKDDKKNREAYATLFHNPFYLNCDINQELTRLPVLSDRVRKSKIDEINSIPKYHKVDVKLFRGG